MIALLQRVQHAEVKVNDQVIGQIAKGLLIFIGVEKEDDQSKADRLVERFLTYRVFADAKDKMNLSVRDIKAGVLLVPQFTLAADTQKGTRPSFSRAADPVLGEQLFDYLVSRCRAQHQQVASGQFAADMKVSLLNDGPVTFWLQV